MPPKVTERALAALAAQDMDGKLDERLETAIDGVTDAALKALTGELGSRSKAARLLMRKGAGAVLAERSARA